MVDWPRQAVTDEIHQTASVIVRGGHLEIHSTNRESLGRHNAADRRQAHEYFFLQQRRGY